MEMEVDGAEAATKYVRVEEDKKSLSSSTPADTKDHSIDQQSAGQPLSEVGSVPVKQDEPPADWFEPLEEDCADDEEMQSWDVESLAGSEQSGSVVDSERNHATGTKSKVKRQRRRVGDGEWEEWPILGEGWKRRAVLRRSGASVGQIDTYYMSPAGERVRSKIELLKYVKNKMDLTNFDFRMGKFFDGEPPKRGQRKRKMGHSSPVDCGFSSESSFQNESVDASDRTYSPAPTFSLGHSTQNRPRSVQSAQKDSTPSPAKSNSEPRLTPTTPNCTLTGQNGPANGGFSSRTSGIPVARSTSPVIPPNAILEICARCRNSFTGVQGQTMCATCSRACNASKDNRNIIFRKWLPCGFCRACQLTEDCGTCASCRKGISNLDYSRPVRCRKRKCLCPTLKKRADESPQFGSMQHKSERLSERLDATVSKVVSDLQYSDSDENSSFDDDDDEEEEEEEEENEDEEGEEEQQEEEEEEKVVKKQRRSCGRCKGCVSKADCGICDFCIDKPKFGGSNKKRQKCRRRQCQREAMRHLLPESGHTPVLTPLGWVVPGRPRPNYTYSRKRAHQSQEKWDFDFSDNEGEERRTNSSSAALHLDREKISISNSKPQPSLKLKISRSNSITENGLQTRVNKILPATTPQLMIPVSTVIKKPDSGADVGVRLIVPVGRTEEEPAKPRAEEKTLQGYTEHEQLNEHEDEEDRPTITQIFSLGGNDEVAGGVDLEPELLEMLTSLRRAMLPVLWCPLLVEGSRLQLLQCSKTSSMADTAVLIEPNLRFHISVQNQPLLPTHRLYSVHPPRLGSVAQVIALLEDLERYAVCRGFEAAPPAGQAPIIHERAATCEFLVMPDAKRCTRCRSGPAEAK